VGLVARFIPPVVQVEVGGMLPDLSLSPDFSLAESVAGFFSHRAFL